MSGNNNVSWKGVITSIVGIGLSATVIGVFIFVFGAAIYSIFFVEPGIVYKEIPNVISQQGGQSSPIYPIFIQSIVIYASVLFTLYVVILYKMAPKLIFHIRRKVADAYARNKIDGLVTASSHSYYIVYLFFPLILLFAAVSSSFLAMSYFPLASEYTNTVRYTQLAVTSVSLSGFLILLYVLIYYIAIRLGLGKFVFVLWRGIGRK